MLSIRFSSLSRSTRVLFAAAGIALALPVVSHADAISTNPSAGDTATPAPEGPHAFGIGELEVTNKVDARLPAFVDPMSAAGAVCDAVVTVDRLGVPTDVKVQGCDPTLMGVTMKTLLRWRFVPPVVDGRSVTATVDVALTY